MIDIFLLCVNEFFYSLYNFIFMFNEEFIKIVNLYGGIDENM